MSASEIERLRKCHTVDGVLSPSEQPRIRFPDIINALTGIWRTSVGGVTPMRTRAPVLVVPASACSITLMCPTQSNEIVVPLPPVTFLTSCTMFSELTTVCVAPAVFAISNREATLSMAMICRQPIAFAAFSLYAISDGIQAIRRGRITDHNGC
jgi:hypothetical protein